ncbi:acyloxyacyl hydrolase [Marinobacter sp. M216]|uniref:Acyloxyacyl hydrolase n=1 Tax=Marinobacter albus TaxID=3030833 RepID=A0ABT7HBY9_9GAMM|nr:MULTISPECIES: acyloxyacyl hydrolase [unclassified Marinobacter]MBW7469687.1 acyloxyacyl hydrolase [Marinobacter sp. F4218]MDK9557891.1 acyloxyacyl hydrolase [Marinobacter sp. M216]
MASPRHLFHFGLLPIFICGLLIHRPSYSADLELDSLSVRARVSEKTMLGEEATEDFKEYDVSANFHLPWNNYSKSGWGIGSRIMASGGLLRGSGKNALVVSLIPELTLGSKGGRFVLDLGVGGALFSRWRFGTQDYGGPFQFALTSGVAIPLYRNLGLGYRFLHYSDAGVNGPDTTGADFHMIEFSYRF